MNGVTDTSLTVIALPTEGDAVHQIGAEQKHATILFLGDITDEADIAEVTAAVVGLSESGPYVPFTAPVTEIGELGQDHAEMATVWFLGESPLSAIRDSLLENETVRRLFDAIEQYPEYIPHTTVEYNTQIPPETLGEVTEITFDRLAIWHGESQIEFPLGEAMPETEEKTEEVTDEPIGAASAAAVPWHGVLAPDGVASGDRRVFSNLGRHRDLPLPLNWQKTSADGHDQNVTVAKIEKIQMISGLMHASGHFLSIPEADEVIGLIAEFGRFGVSVDADDVGEMQFDEENEREVYIDPRVCSACIVGISAFPEAYLSLGEHPVLDAEPEETDEAENETAAGLEEFDRGPGWITHPEETRRIHAYWTQPGQPGFIKVGWGSGGDFNRCRALVGEKIATNSPEDTRYLNQICTQWHHDALGTWPGEHKAAADTLEGAEQGPGLTLVASAVEALPAEWFANPGLTEPTGVVITDDGHVFGHIATWGTCHIGLAGDCTAPPRSETDYAYFATGSVLTDVGAIRVANLTAGIGHAPDRAGVRIAAAHYDNTDAVWADVVVGEDEVGIWFAGALRPGASEELVYAARAAGRLSGDWRKVRLASGHENYEMVGALSINVAGFPIPHAGLVAGAQVSLIAAGVVQPTEADDTLGNVKSLSMLASMVVDEMQARERRQSRMSALREKVSTKGGE